jgi:hypothetical protein
VRLEGLGKLKRNSFNTSGLKPTTLRRVATTSPRKGVPIPFFPPFPQDSGDCFISGSIPKHKEGSQLSEKGQLTEEEQLISIVT